MLGIKNSSLSSSITISFLDFKMRFFLDDKIVSYCDIEIKDGDILLFELCPKLERFILKRWIGFYTFEEKELPTGSICGFDYKSSSLDSFASTFSFASKS